MKLTRLFEITFSDAPQVDRDAGVIRGVRILGRVSRNGREYSDAALRQAARLYEGLGVNLNHPQHVQNAAARSVEDGFGWLEAIDIRGDGVYGDLHYFRAHPQAEVIVEAAERNPRRFGLSHHAEGSVARRQGKLVVESIETVRSVDLVQNPATNNGLFESETPAMNCTVREILAEAGGPLAALIAAPEYHEAGQASVALDGSAGDESRLAAALTALLVHLLEDERLDHAARLERAARALEAHAAKPMAEPGENAPSLAELRERLERIETESHCRRLLESADRACDPDRLSELAALPTDDERLRVIEAWPAREAAVPRRARPRVSRPLCEDRSDIPVFPGDVRSFVAAIR